MINHNELIKIYKQNLEDSIVSYISAKKQLPLEVAMDIFYRSELSKQISEGKYGIENLDYKYLADDLIQNETGLFEEEK